MIRTYFPTVLVLSIGLLYGCEPATPVAATPPRVAFYHWRSRLALADTERAWQDRLRAERLYVRLFDVDLVEGQAIPVGPLEVIEWPGHREIVPTVFITNRTLMLDPVALDSLAARLFRKVTQYTAERPYAELQLDCDWTERTRANYFYLLERVRALLPVDRALSVTIRLHQFKYPERTGVPPADRGMLMAYNVGSLTDWEATNSILTPAALRRYFQRTDYPLPLDLALPLFRWGVIFRAGTGPKLINGLDTTALADTTRFLRLDRGRYRVRRSGYLNAYYLYQGDRLRLEWMEPDSLRAAARILQHYPWPGGWHLAFYHLDEQQLQYYDHAAIDSIPTILAPPTAR